jgi:hypothetical protein
MQKERGKEHRENEIRVKRKMAVREREREKIYIVLP